MPRETATVDVSAVIVHTGGGSDGLRDCLTTLFDTVKLLHLEAVVVDNASGTDGLQELLSEFPGARIVALPRRMGYPAATNSGVKESSGRHVLWCNDDLLFHAGTVDLLAAFLDSHGEYGAAGPRMLNPDGSFQPCFSLVHISLLALTVERLNVATFAPKRWSASRSIIGREADEQDVAVGGGACMMIRRSALDSIGGNIDERFFLYLEEFDLSYRLQKAGWKIRYIPDAAVIHVGGQTTVPLVAAVPTHFRWIIQAWRSRFAYVRKHFGTGTERIYAAVFVLTAIPRWLVMQLRGLVALLVGDRTKAAALRARARVHAFAARMAVTAARHHASEYPEYPPA